MTVHKNQQSRYENWIRLASMARAPGLKHEVMIRCRRRPNKQVCKNLIEVLRSEVPQVISWRCPGCNDNGVIKYSSIPKAEKRTTTTKQQSDYDNRFDFSEESEFPTYPAIDLPQRIVNAPIDWNDYAFLLRLELDSPFSMALLHCTGPALKNEYGEACAPFHATGVYLNSSQQHFIILLRALEKSALNCTDPIQQDRIYSIFDSLCHHLPPPSHMPNMQSFLKANQMREQQKLARKKQRNIISFDLFANTKASEKTCFHEFVFQIAGVSPPVARRFRILSTATLHELHLGLQAIMGWSSKASYEFCFPHEWRYTKQEANEAENLRNSEEVSVAERFAIGSELSYYYGDFDPSKKVPRQRKDKRNHSKEGRPDTCWHLRGHLEAILTLDEKDFGSCLLGYRNAPPEEIEGPHDYERFLEAYYQLEQNQEGLDNSMESFESSENLGHTDQTKAKISPELLAAKWLQDGIDPASFALLDANQRIQDLFGQRPKS